MELKEKMEVVFLNSDRNPLQVTKYDYCLLCGDVSVLYYKDKIMKREADERWDGQSFQDLFDHLLKELGVNKKGKCEWNFDKEPLPLCVGCEQLFHSLGQACRTVQKVTNEIKTVMSQGENVYLGKDIYNKQDTRFFEFRKQALGENFKGNSVMSTDNGKIEYLSNKQKSDSPVVKEGVQIDGKLIKTGMAVRNEPVASISASATLFKELSSTSSFPEKTKVPISNPSSDNVPEVSPSDSSTDKQNPTIHVPSCETKEEVNPPIESNAKATEETTSTTLRRSLRVRNKEVKYREDSPPPCEDDSTFCNEKANENFNTTSSESDFKIGKSQHVTFTSKVPRSSSSVRGGARDRGRKRKREADDFITARKHLYDAEWRDLSSTCKVKRGRRKGSKNKQSTGSIVQHTRKRYTSRNLKIEADVNNDQAFNNMDVNEKYFIAPTFKDPLSGNYYYRQIQYVWIAEENAFQCSTCSIFIRSETEYGLKGKFHRHYIVAHSDRFRCRLCSAWNMFQSDLELHNHFRVYHRGFYHFEPELDWRYRSRRVRTSFSSSFGVSNGPRRLHFKPVPCAICGKPNNRRDKKELEMHQLSHMNADEKETYLKNTTSIETFRKRTRVVVNKDQFTTPPCERLLAGRPCRTRRKTKVSTKTLKYCYVCGKDDIVRGDFSEHRMTHMNEMEKAEFLEKNQSATKSKNEIDQRLQPSQSESMSTVLVAEDEPLAQQLGIWNKCNICGEMLPTGLTDKSQPVELEPSSKILCSNCYYEIYSSHMESHLHETDKKENDNNDMIPFVSCEYPNCGVRFLQEDVLKHHVQIEHIESAVAEDQVVCMYCGLVFRRKEESPERIHNHAKTATNEKINHQCSICQKIFKYKFKLKKHLAEDHGKVLKGFRCYDFECEATFLTMSGLRSHLRKKNTVVMNDEILRSAGMDEPIDVEEASSATVQEAVSHSGQEEQDNEISIIEELVAPRDIEFALSTMQILDNNFDYYQLLK